MNTKRETLESTVSQLETSGKRVEVAELIMKEYGDGIRGFLVDRCGNPSDADEIIGMFTDKIVKHGHTYRGEGSLRAWAYRVARNEMKRFYSNKWHPKDRTGVTGLPQHGATTKPPWRQTEVKTRVRELREQLSDADQEVLVLRVDREFSWNEVAEYLNDGPFGTDDERKRAANNAASQYRHAKARLEQLMKADGLLATT